MKKVKVLHLIIEPTYVIPEYFLAFQKANTYIYLEFHYRYSNVSKFEYSPNIIFSYFTEFLKIMDDSTFRDFF